MHGWVRKRKENRKKKERGKIGTERVRDKKWADLRGKKGKDLANQIAATPDRRKKKKTRSGDETRSREKEGKSAIGINNRDQTKAQQKKVKNPILQAREDPNHMETERKNRKMTEELGVRHASKGAQKKFFRNAGVT